MLQLPAQGFPYLGRTMQQYKLIFLRHMYFKCEVYSAPSPLCAAEQRAVCVPPVLAAPGARLAGLAGVGALRAVGRQALGRPREEEDEKQGQHLGAN